jgi:transketolase
MNITERNIKLWQSIGQRATYGLSIMELAKLDNKLVVVTSDTSTSAGLDRFKKKYPERYFDIGIAEQNTLGVAAGLANEGLNVFVSTFAPFQTMRCLEQIKINLAYMEIPITFVGLASGLSLGYLGYSHCCIEDCGVLRSLPNISIISPSDSLETVKAVYAASSARKSTYIRLTGDNNSVQLNNNDYNFQIGKAIKIIEGKKIAFLATGVSVGESKKAVEMLYKKDIFCSLYNFHTIKPIDLESLEKIASKYELIFTIEEHNIIGGLGSAVSEVLTTKKNRPKQFFIGVKDTYKNTGSYREVLEKSGISAEKIYQKVITEVKAI